MSPLRVLSSSYKRFSYVSNDLEVEVSREMYFRTSMFRKETQNVLTTLIMSLEAALLFLFEDFQFEYVSDDWHYASGRYLLRL